MGLADPLFCPPLQDLLATLFMQPQRTFTASELVERAGGEALRHLEALERCGHVFGRRIGTQKRYRANTASPIFREVRAIAVKTFAVVEPLRAAMAPLERHILQAWLRGIDPDEDARAWGELEMVAIVKPIAESRLAEALSKVDIGREVRLRTFTQAQWETADRRTREHWAAEPRLFISSEGRAPGSPP